MNPPSHLLLSSTEEEFTDDISASEEYALIMHEYELSRSKITQEFTNDVSNTDDYDLIMNEKSIHHLKNTTDEWETSIHDWWNIAMTLFDSV